MSYDEMKGMSAEAIRAKEEYLVNVGIGLAEAKEQPIPIKVGEDNYIFYGGEYRLVRDAEPLKERFAPVFKAFSLQGLVDYIKADVDGVFRDKDKRHIVSVDDVDVVRVYTPVIGWHRERACVVECRALLPQIPFGRFLETDEFQIMVQTRFADDPNREDVLKLSGNVVGEQSLQKADDGVSQRVTAKTGVVSMSQVIVKNPIKLVPLRTFHEVEQPTSPFVLRFNESSEAALFEGDGGAWKIKAVENVKNWLRAQLKDCNVEVIA